MKNSKEIASTVFQARDEYREQQQIKNRRIRKAAAVSGTACALCLTVVGAGYWNVMQTKLPTVPMNSETENTSGTQGLECLPEEGDETVAQVTIPDSVGNEIAEDPIMTLPASIDTQTEKETSIVEVRTETITNTVTPITTENSKAPATENTDAPPVQTETLPPASERTEEQITEEFFEVPQWDEKTISEQFVEFTADDMVYVTRCSKIPNEHIGEKLYDVVVTGYDDYADEIRYADASVYRINDISEECAVSVRFQGYDEGYVYTGRSYFPETLGELMDALNLKETISFHTLCPAQGGAGITDYDRSLLMALLQDHRDLARVEDDAYHKPLFSVSTNIDLLGITNKSLKVTEDGYLITNIMEWGYAFYIGEETATELAEALGIEKASAPVSSDTNAEIETTPANEVIMYE